MKRIKLTFASLLFALIFSATAIVPSGVTAQENKVAEPQKEIPITIVDGRKRPVKVESLSSEDQARVKRVRLAAQTLLDPSGPQALTVHIHCEYPPLKCTIDIKF